ncbi:hypothetical protein GCM10010124_15410 [Pilimelia terevasa]|uniref:Activator of Hsp90 ATPase homologue 1/2-like C-terminal domain-containing protein n=1 Tax=Pilimelia terevasa TaxID=53372 RepID=A0A8J3BLT6_9ACTN|nr:SRPBCC domain-containing protein [Pilimelia terevasa]GGK23830.1 hypothetical protein GCM10010124_15410 [Pilimelia terevasa]
MTPYGTGPAPAPLLHTVTVARPPDVTFALFTGGFGRWWPLSTHSVGGPRAVAVRLGDSVGGQVVEAVADGPPVLWGTVTVWDPPYRVAFSWHPGTPEPEATYVEVTFTRVDAATEVTLRHAGWANRPDGPAARERYARDWPLVLDHFTRACAAADARQ